MRGLLPREVFVLSNATPCAGGDLPHLVADPFMVDVARALYSRGLLGLEPCQVVPDARHLVTNELGRWLLRVQLMIDTGVMP